MPGLPGKIPARLRRGLEPSHESGSLRSRVIETTIHDDRQTIAAATAPSPGAVLFQPSLKPKKQRPPCVRLASTTGNSAGAAFSWLGDDQDEGSGLNTAPVSAPPPIGAGGGSGSPSGNAEGSGSAGSLAAGVDDGDAGVGAIAGDGFCRPSADVPGASGYGGINSRPGGGIGIGGGVGIRGEEAGPGAGIGPCGAHPVGLGWMNLCHQL